MRFSLANVIWTSIQRAALILVKDVGETSTNIKFLDSGDVGENNVGDKISAHSQVYVFVRTNIQGIYFFHPHTSLTLLQSFRAMIEFR